MLRPALGYSALILLTVAYVFFIFEPHHDFSSRLLGLPSPSTLSSADVDKCVAMAHRVPEMSLREVEVFKFVTERPGNLDRTYFEWGMGGSTTIAAPWFRFTVAVDNHPDWCQAMQSDPRLQCVSALERLDLQCVVPTTELQNFARPYKKDVHKFGPYFGAIGEASVRHGIKVFDVIHVDGRFRVRCALEALEYMDENSLLLVHDYNNRPGYWELNSFFVNDTATVKRFSSKERYAVFKKRHGVSRAKVADAKERYKLDSG